MSLDVLLKPAPPKEQRSLDTSQKTTKFLIRDRVILVSSAGQSAGIYKLKALLSDVSAVLNQPRWISNTN